MTAGGTVLVAVLAFLVFIGLGALVFLAVSVGEALISGKRHHLRKPAILLACGVVGASLLLNVIQISAWVTGGPLTLIVVGHGDPATLPPRHPVSARRAEASSASYTVASPAEEVGSTGLGTVDPNDAMRP